MRAVMLFAVESATNEALVVMATATVSVVSETASFNGVIAKVAEAAPAGMVTVPLSAV